MKIQKFINVAQDSYELYEYMKENGFTDETFEEFEEDGGELSFFEGDPDMIKLDGETCYFALCGDIVFYYADHFIADRVQGILRDFFAPGKMVHYGYYRYYAHEKTVKAENCNWDTFDALPNVMAYRGGCGYTYDIIPLAA